MTESLSLKNLLKLGSNGLSVEDNTNMGIKVLVFHLDNLDCKHCQQLHQKLEELKEDFEKSGYYLFLYYSRIDQDVFSSFRKEFNTKIDVASFIDKKIHPTHSSECKSSIYEVFGTYFNNFSHEEITIGFNQFVQSLDVNFLEKETYSSMSSMSSISSEASFESFEKPFKRKRRSSEFIKKTLLKSAKRLSKNWLNLEFKTAPTFDTEIFGEEVEEKPIAENYTEKYLEHQQIKDTLEMGFKVLMFQMDDLKCDHCLKIHQSINDQLNDLSEAMITPMLTYSKFDQNMFNLLNRVTKNKLEIHENENILKSNHTSNCQGHATIMFDFENIIEFEHDEISMDSIASSCGIKKSKKYYKSESSNIHNTFQEIFNKPMLIEKLESLLDEETIEIDELTPNFLLQHMTLDDILRDGKLVQKFYIYLKKECAEENLIFL